MATMRAPQGVTQVSVEQQNFMTKPDGTVAVPDNFVAKLKEIGFQEVAQRIAVSPEAAAAIAAAAAKLNLPDPGLTKTIQPAAEAPKAALFPNDNDGAGEQPGTKQPTGTE